MGRVRARRTRFSKLRSYQRLHAETAHHFRLHCRGSHHAGWLRGITPTLRMAAIASNGWRSMTEDRNSFRGVSEMQSFKRRRQRQRLRRTTKAGSVLIGAAALGGAYGGGWLHWPRGAEAAPSLASSHAQFSLCFTGGGYNCVVDGDTIWLKGEKIRIADIDAPETHEPRCASEKELGDQATL